MPLWLTFGRIISWNAQKTNGAWGGQRFFWKSGSVKTCCANGSTESGVVAMRTYDGLRRNLWSCQIELFSQKAQSCSGWAKILGKLGHFMLLAIPRVCIYVRKWCKNIRFPPIDGVAVGSASTKYKHLFSLTESQRHLLKLLSKPCMKWFWYCANRKITLILRQPPDLVSYEVKNLGFTS